MSERSGPTLADAVARGEGLSPETPGHALLAALEAAAGGDPDGAEAIHGAARHLGAQAAEAGSPVDAAVARAIALGRALGKRAAEAGAGETAARLGPLVDAAAVAAAAGWEDARADRREAWMSVLTHDLKSRLNVVNLNLWLLRQGRPLADRDAEKHEKIERAMAHILDVVKDLHARARAPVPSPPPTHA